MQLLNIWLAPPSRLCCRQRAQDVQRARRVALAERCASPLPIVTLRYIARALAERQGRVTAAIKTQQGVAGRHTHGLTHAYPLEMSLSMVRLGINLACARVKCHTPRAAVAAAGALPGLLCSVMPGACVGPRRLPRAACTLVTEAETVGLLHISRVPQQQRLCSVWVWRALRTTGQTSPPPWGSSQQSPSWSSRAG